MDGQGRAITKLRVSLTEECNLHCFHCRRQGRQESHPVSSALPPLELQAIVRRLVERGVRQVRLTGGEPTLRHGLVEIVRLLGDLGLQRLGMTSNGILLAPLLSDLVAAGLDNLNLSLDSLDPAVFERITGSCEHGRVLESLRLARALGLETKLNVVVFRGINEGELLRFIQLAESSGIPVRFLELIRIGPDHEALRHLFVSADEMLDHIRKGGVHLHAHARATDATSFDYMTGQGGRIGFIASESRPFCKGCSRLRLSADGVLRPCLMREQGVSVRNLADSQWDEILEQVLEGKPDQRPPHATHSMVRMGG